MEELKYLVALSHVPGMGPKRYAVLEKHFGTAERIWKAPREILNGIQGLGNKFPRDFISTRSSLSPHRLHQRTLDLGITLYGKNTPGYPGRLENIYDPPFLLYTRGLPVDWQRPWVALVGSRKMTSYGREMAFRLAKELAVRGIGVVSGLARGIDTWAHRGALKGGGWTAAVLGCGLDRCYPPENRKLMEEIQERGLVISEFPPGTGPKPYHFPLRNRIISGISLGTVVVEAAEKSGALITADQALEQGRDVFAVPGPITSPASRGCHNLIKQGAKLVQDVDDLLEELNLPDLPELACPLTVESRVENIGPQEQKLLDLIPYHPVHPDTLVGESGWPAGKVKAALTILEIKGMIAQEAGNLLLRIK